MPSSHASAAPVPVRVNSTAVVSGTTTLEWANQTVSAVVPFDAPAFTLQTGALASTGRQSVGAAPPVNPRPCRATIAAVSLAATGPLTSQWISAPVAP